MANSGTRKGAFVAATNPTPTLLTEVEVAKQLQMSLAGVAGFRAAALLYAKTPRKCHEPWTTVVGATEFRV